MKDLKFNIRMAMIATLLIIASSAEAIAASATPNGCNLTGPSLGKVLIEEFADFTCPYCVRGANTLKAIRRDYAGKVRVVFRNAPLPAHGPIAMTAAKAFTAICMQSPTLADAFQQELFDKQSRLVKEGEPFIFATAEKLGADVDRLKADINSRAVIEAVANDQKAFEARGFRGTPSFMVGSEPVVGAVPYEEFKAIIDRQSER